MHQLIISSFSLFLPRNIGVHYDFAGLFLLTHCHYYLCMWLIMLIVLLIRFGYYFKNTYLLTYLQYSVNKATQLGVTTV